MWGWIVALIFLIGGIVGCVNAYLYNLERHKSDIPKWTSTLVNGTFMDEFLRVTLPKLPWWVTKIVYALFGLALLTIGIIAILVELKIV